MKSLLTSNLLPSRLQYGVSKSRVGSNRNVDGFVLYGRKNHNSLGFTLIELMIVVAIIGILGGIGIPAYMGYLERAKVVTAVAEIKMINTEIEAYRAINDGNLPNNLSAVNYQNFLDPWGKPYKYKNLEGGGGAASLAPSFASAKKGAKVIVLEKRHTLGGNPAIVNGLFPAESAYQKRLKIDTPRDELFRAAMDFDHSPAKGLTIDGRMGVTGVRETIIKETIKTTSKGVIVTTGGYGGNKRLLKTYSPAYHKNMMLVGLPLMEGRLLLAKGGGGGGKGGEDPPPPPPDDPPPEPPPPGGGGGAGKQDANGFDINTDYDLYSSGKDGASNKSLTHKNSRDDVIRADNGLFIGPVSKY